MTVETSTRKATFTGGQASLVFSFRTLTSNPEYIKVKLQNVSTGAETALSYSADYSVTVNSDGVGGTVTVSPTYSTAYNYVVYRETTAKQESDYDDYNQFPANTVENDFDRSILIAQEQAEETTRTLRYPISESGANTELPAPEANAFLAWNASGTGLVNADIPDPSTLVKATSLEASAGVDDTHYMTPAKTATAISSLGQVLTKASQVVAEAASDNTTYMTPLQVKNEVQKLGAVSIPAANITGLGVPGTPNFSATVSGAQSIPFDTQTKISLTTETFDSDGCFSSSRFTPTVAGKYLFIGKIFHTENDTTTQTWSVSIFKNGSTTNFFNYKTYSGMGASNNLTEEVMGLLDMNGSSDYVELYVYQAGNTSSAHSLHGSLGDTTFAGYRVA